MRTEAERTVAGQRVSPVIPSARLSNAPGVSDLSRRDGRLLGRYYFFPARRSIFLSFSLFFSFFSKYFCFLSPFYCLSFSFSLFIILLVFCLFVYLFTCFFFQNCPYTRGKKARRVLENTTEKHADTEKKGEGREN